MTSPSPARRTGALLAGASAVGFASKGIFAKLLYARGWDFESVLTVRAILALPLVWAWSLWRAGPASMRGLRPNAIAGAAAAGVFCYFFGALLNFYALTVIAASIERVLLFTYPSMVVLLHAMLHRRRPTRRAAAALALTYLGILLVVGGPDIGILKNNLYGAGLVLVCAFTFAVYYLASDRWTRELGSAPFTVIALSAATVALVVYGLAAHGSVASVHGGVADAWLMAGLVMFATVFPMLLMTEGVRRLGAQRSAIVSTIGPPATLFLGALFLGERLSPIQWGGAAIILAGILLMQSDSAPATP